MTDMFYYIGAFVLALILGVLVIISNVMRLIESLKNEENEEFEV